MIPKKLLEEITRWITDKRYGSLQINFQDGKIVNVNRSESLKVDNLISNSSDSKVSVVSADTIHLDS